MIWVIEDNGDGVDPAFIQSFVEAGIIDQAVVAAQAQTAPRPRPQSSPELPRYYSLLKNDPRIKLVAVGQPLEGWLGKPTKVTVGTFIIIGEFALNKPLKGQKGLSLKLESLDTLQGRPSEVFDSGSSLLDAISTEVLDLPLLAKRAKEQAAAKARRQSRPAPYRFDSKKNY